MDQIQIVPATWHDWRSVHALEKTCFGRDAWGIVELWFALLSSGVRLKAVAEQRVVGFVLGQPHPDYAWIATLAVHPHFQRRGLGTRLLAEVENRLAISTLKLTVRRSNTPAIALYQKFGYAAVNTWDNYYADGEAGLVMEKTRVR